MRKVEGAKVYGLCLERLEFQIASILLGETVRFNFSDEGFLCIYLILKKSSAK